MKSNNSVSLIKYDLEKNNNSDLDHDKSNQF